MNDLSFLYYLLKNKNKNKFIVEQSDLALTLVSFKLENKTKQKKARLGFSYGHGSRTAHPEIVQGVNHGFVFSSSPSSLEPREGNEKCHQLTVVRNPAR